MTQTRKSYHFLFSLCYSDHFGRKVRSPKVNQEVKERMEKTNRFEVDLQYWIKQQETEFRGNAYYSPGLEYFKILEEILVHEDTFFANCNDLVDKASKHSATFISLSDENKKYVSDLMTQTIFDIEW